MKSTKSQKILLTFILITMLVYNFFLNSILTLFDQYEMNNRFFIIFYTLRDEQDLMTPNAYPNFLNWVFILTFIIVFVFMIIRIRINRHVYIYKKRTTK
jgi:hypothetical protein